LSLLQQTVSGVKWNVASQLGQQVTQIFTLVVLARLLSPTEFGLLGMATVFTGLVSLFKDLGTCAAVIQSRNATSGLLCSVFWTNLTLGVGSTVVVASTAPLVAAYYREPRITAVLRFLSIGFVISGCSVLQKAIFERNLAFRITAWSETAGVVGGAVVGIASALMGAGIWALVAQALVSASVTSALLWAFSDWRPTLTFEWAEIKRVSGFSLGLTGFNFVNYFARNADYLLIGRFLGANQLGIYTLAYRVMLYPLQSVTAVVSRVTFPVCTQFQDDDARFRSAYLRTAAMIGLVTFPIVLGVYSVARPLVLTIFGSKWTSAIPLIAILTPIGLIQSITSTVGIIYQAKGRGKTFFAWGIGSSSLIVTGFVVGLHWGVQGVAGAYAVVMLIITIPCFAIPFRFIGLKLKSFTAVLVRPLASSMLMMAVIFASRIGLLHLGQSAHLWVLIPAGVVSYIACSWIVNRNQLRQFAALLGENSEL